MIKSLLDWKTLAPFATYNHPSIEHLVPFFVAMGAGKQGKLVHSSFDMAALCMDNYEFDTTK